MTAGQNSSPAIQLSTDPARRRKMLFAVEAVTGLASTMLEGLASSDLSPRGLSRVLGAYNLVWAGIGALAVAVNGSIIEHWPKGVFIIPPTAHALGLMLLSLTPAGPTPAAAPDEK